MCSKGPIGLDICIHGMLLLHRSLQHMSLTAENRSLLCFTDVSVPRLHLLVLRHAACSACSCRKAWAPLSSTMTAGR